MADIRPFRGTRFQPKAGAPDMLVAPPYDVLSSEERDAYAAKSPYNVVHLTLPEQRPDDRSKYVKYARSAAALADWKREGVLGVDSASFYRLRQTFRIPGTEQDLVRTALIGMLKVEPYEKGVVLPHEQTFPKHKEDRLRILEATRSHLECIYGLFEDDRRDVFDLIDAAPAETVVDVTTDDGVRHVLEAITSEPTCREIHDALADKKVWIADGHHRYETAVTFREQLGPRDELVPEDFMMMAFSSMNDPGLVLLPTHRIVSNFPLSLDEVAEKLAPYFEVKRVPNELLWTRLAGTAQDGRRAIGIALPAGEGLLAEYGDPEALSKAIDAEGSTNLLSLDVSILHGLIFAQLLDIQGTDRISYTRDEEEAIREGSVEGQAAFLMNPPTVDDMRRVALGGEKMPQKSTYYYPKLLSGLLIWSLEDF